MPKLKTHSGAKKRFNLTKTGKVKRAKAFKSQADSSPARRWLCGRYQYGCRPQDDPLQVSYETFEIGGFYNG